MNSILVPHFVYSAKESQWTQTLEVIVSTVMELLLQMVPKLLAVSRDGVNKYNSSLNTFLLFHLRWCCFQASEPNI